MSIEEILSWIFALAFLWWCCTRNEAKIRRKEKDDDPPTFV